MDRLGYITYQDHSPSYRDGVHPLDDGTIELFTNMPRDPGQLSERLRKIVRGRNYDLMFLYLGFMDERGKAYAELATRFLNERSPLMIVGCTCDDHGNRHSPGTPDFKQRLAKRYEVPIIRTPCGGAQFLENLLGASHTRIPPHVPFHAHAVPEAPRLAM